jgi:NAD(P)-dependent dehydrogenase (short-subunit alcohol dehydrogenase family)
MRFDGLTAVVAGAATGIGRASAELLCRRGAAVALLDINADAGEQLQRELTLEHGDVSFHCADVARSEQVEAAVNEAYHRHGGIDILVYSAGIQRYGSALDTPAATWDEVLAVNLSGAWHAARCCLPHLVERGGAIVNVSSVQALATQENVCAYTVSKHGLVGLTRSLAVDFGGQGVRANVICPGTVDTPMFRWTMSRDPDPDSVYRNCEAMHPVGRIAEATEIAEVIAFLAHSSSSFVNGAVWTVDGGLLSRIGGAPRAGALLSEA